MPSLQPVALFGIYNADGGLRGELRYIAGRMFGTTHCELCDVTHSPIRRKREWDEFVANLRVPFTLLHRNELSLAPTSVQALGARDLPCVIAELSDGSARRVLEPDEIRPSDGSVSEFASRVKTALIELR